MFSLLPYRIQYNFLERRYTRPLWREVDLLWTNCLHVTIQTVQNEKISERRIIFALKQLQARIISPLFLLTSFQSIWLACHQWDALSLGSKNRCIFRKEIWLWILHLNLQWLKLSPSSVRWYLDTTHFWLIGCKQILKWYEFENIDHVARFYSEALE